MAMYAAFDLHATNSYLAIIDGEGVPVFKEEATQRVGDLAICSGPVRGAHRRGGRGIHVQLVLAGGLTDGSGISGASGQSVCHSEIQGTQALR